MPTKIRYYYTHVSPWSYLGHARLGELAARHGASIDYVPITLGAIFPRTGGLPLADGCFGAPWYLLDGEPFWGQDRLELLEEALENR